MKLLLSSMVSLLAVGPLAATEFYVAPSGADDGPGSKSQPFATIERARTAVAQARSAAEPTTVWLAGGRYVTREGYAFTEQDSGTAEAPVSYQAMPGAEVVLSAGVMAAPAAVKPVTNPELLARLRPEAKGKIVEIDLGALGIHPEPLPDYFRKLQLPEVFYRGKRAPLARWPNGEVFSTIEKVTDNGITPPHGGAFVYRGEQPARWLQALRDGGVWIRGFWRVPWAIEGVKVKSIDPATRSIVMDAVVTGGIGSKYQRDKNGFGPGDGKEPWHALNLLEEIDQPGEWSIDFRTNTLYLWPPGEIAAGSLFIADGAKPVVALKGVSEVSFKRLIVDGGMGQGIGIVGGDHVTIAGCTVRNVGDCGIFIKGGRLHQVLSCNVYDTGQEGISFTGGERATLTPGGHQIINNHVYRIGQNYPAAAIVAGNGVGSETVGNLVAHNCIHDVPNCGIVFAGNENVFEYNEIYRIGLGSSDLGCFYSTGGWTARGNVIRYNFVHHSMNSNAFYMDDGDSGNLVYGNVDYKTASGGFIGGGHDHTFTGNIFIECTRAMHVDDRGVSRHYNAQDKRLTHDLQTVPYQTPPWSSRYPQLVHLVENQPDVPSGIVIEDNLIVSCGQDLRKSGNLANFEGVIYRDNVVTHNNSEFVDPANFDFALKPGAETALHLKNFKPIPFAKIGLALDPYRTSLPTRDNALLRSGNTERHFDSQTDLDASNR